MLDRAFRLGLDSKNPSATLGKTSSSKTSTTSTKSTSKTSTKTPSKSTTQSASQVQPNQKDPFHSVVQGWATASSQSPSPNASGSTANAPSGAWPQTTGDTQNTKSTKKKSATGDTKTAKKGTNGYLLLFIFVVCGIGGYLFGSDSTPTNSNASRSSGSAPPPRTAPNNVPAQAAPPQYNSAPTGADPFVVALQQELNRRGFNAGAVDGLIGPQTYNAITSAQSAFNMLIDGVPSDALLRALRRN